MHKGICISLLLLSLAGCAKGPTTPTPAAESRAARDDKSAADDLAEKDKTAPALAWLADSKHALWKGDRIRIKLHFEDLQRAGIKDISAVGIEDMEGTQVCASFVVTLPPPGDEKRPRAFSKHNDFWKSYLGSDATEEDLKDFLVKDEGQRYFFYNFDL